MSYEPESTRVDLGGGNWVTFFKDVLHGTQKSVNTLTRPFLKYPKGKGPKIVQGKDEILRIEGMLTPEIDLKGIDFDAVTDAIIVGQAKEWSFGEVSQVTLASIPESIRGKMKAAVDRLYGDSVPLAPGGAAN